jgi:hydrogenase nickel incorporation protein HypA/HybF
MHELGVTRNVVAIVSEHAAGRRVVRIKLEVGRLSGFMPEALQFCFDVCAQGTAAEGARLDIVDIEGRGHCAVCGAEPKLEFPVGRCPNCQAPSLAIVAGEELNIREMEVL